MSFTTTFCKDGFLTLTGKKITINGNEGWRAITIKCPSDSASDIIVSSDLTGVATMGGEVLGQIVMKAGAIITVGVNSNADVDGLIIDTLSGGTAEIAGSRFQTVAVVTPT